MITEKATIKCEAIFNEDKTHRLLWKRVWDKDKPCACVVMLNPCTSDNVISDVSTFLAVNNVAKLGEFGGITVVNIFSLLTTKLDFNNLDLQLNDYQNDNYIKKSAEEASIVILAWGKSQDSNAKIFHRAEQVLELLEPYKSKLRVITDGERVGLHPLSPAIRAYWDLVNIDEWLKESREKAAAREEKERLKAAEAKARAKESVPE